MASPQTSHSSISTISTLTDDIPQLAMSSLDSLSSVPHAFNLPSLLHFRTDLLPHRDASSPLSEPQHVPRLPSASIAQLPDELLDRILNHLSTRPSSEHPLWETSRDAKNTMAFATCSTRMLHIFRNRLIAIRTRPQRFRDDPLHTPPTAGAVIDITSAADVDHLAALLRLAGPALRELIVTRSLPRNTWVDSLVACSANLEKLSLRDVNADYPLQQILQAVSRTLKELEIVGATGMALSPAQLSSLGTNASSVHSLTLRLSMFEHDWTPVWTGLGPGLKYLSLGATRFWIMDTEEDFLLRQIGMYCADIKHLHFYHLGPTLGPSCARLCARYGMQLDSLSLEQSQLHRADLQTIATNCPRTEISVTHGSSLFSHAYNVDVIDLLGPQIRSLRYRSQLAHDESLWDLPQTCTNLRELRLDCASTLSEEALGAIMRKTSPNLRSLSMGFFVRGLHTALASSALVHLSNHANSLEEFHLGGQRFEIAPFQKLADRCKYSLKKVSVTFGFRTAGEREVIDTDAIVEVIEALYPCEKLTSLVILDRTSTDNRAQDPLVRQACFPFRGRARRISVCGVDYVI